MNQLLLEADQIGPAGDVAITSPRQTRHLREVLRVAIGNTIRVGVCDGDRGLAEVLSTDGDAFRLHCVLDRPPLPRSADTLLLAVPRPKVLARILEQATAVGYGRIVLFRSWHVDKSHLRSDAVDADALRARVVAGLEQSGRTFVPSIERFDLFKPFVEDHLVDCLPTDARRFVADVTTTAGPPQETVDAPFAIAIGPERGFTEYEVDMLRTRDFEPLRLNDGVLRVETAVVVAHALLARPTQHA